MCVNRSFTDYVAKRFDNNFWGIAEKYIAENKDTLGIELYKIHREGEREITDVVVEHVWVDDLPEMNIQFDVALSICLEISEGDYHYDNSEETIIWIMVRCRGNLENKLDDFEVFDVKGYNGRNRAQNPMDDSLVPYIPYEKLEDVAKEFLKNNYPEALTIKPTGQSPVWVNPYVLADSLGLKIDTRRIKEDTSVFGQIYFEDTYTQMYQEEVEEDSLVHVAGRTIIVDPQMFLLRNLGSVNNTIIHECVHWVKHRKAFVLEKLFNADASYISCEVVGRAASLITKRTVEFMERQANQLTPRIQMPADPFRAKANEYIGKFMRETDAKYMFDVIENVIYTLETEFAVSRQAAKIRLVELGFEEAAGTFIYLDGHYVKSHSYKKGAIQLNQTFSVSAQDAAIQRFSNLELREKTQRGDYLFIDNHMVYNAPLYVKHGLNNQLELTDYARSHMDECCLVFDMTIVNNIEHAYHTECFLNRDSSNITFEIKYHNGYENATQSRQVAIRQKEMDEVVSIRKQMTDDPEQCMELLLNWRNRTYTELGDAIDRNPKTISRIVKGETSPQLETAILICFELNLPPMISTKLLEVLGCKLSVNKIEHQWINEALYLKYPEPLWAVREYLEQYNVTI